VTHSRVLHHLSLSVFTLVFSSASLDAQDNRGALEFLNLVPEVAAPRPLPTPTGAHAIGTVAYHLVDHQRTEDASADPDDLRQVIVQLWYPATPTNALVRAEYFPELAPMRGALRTHTDTLPRRIAEDLAVLATVRGHSFVAPEAARDSEGQGFPVVILSPGGNMSRRYHTALMEELASHGYIAVSVSHPYVGWDVFPAGGFIKSINWGLNSDDDSEAMAAEDRLALILVDDVRLVLAHLGTLDASGRFAGRFDLGRMALLGHSRGVLTVARGCQLIKGIDACIAMDVIGPDSGAELDVPWLTLRRATWDEARVEGLRAFVSGNARGAWIGTIAGASHFTFSDMPLVDPEHYQTEIDPLRGHATVAKTVLGFLGLHLGESGAPADVEAVLGSIPGLALEFVASGTRE
jgi:hypothetical protein